MWKEITDKNQAWELMRAGLLFYGPAAFESERVPYPVEVWGADGKHAWDAAWCRSSYWMPSYIRLEA